MKLYRLVESAIRSYVKQCSTPSESTVQSAGMDGGKRRKAG
jgi:hypothetical protein